MSLSCILKRKGISSWANLSHPWVSNGMTTIYGHHTRVMALCCMVEGKGVSSWVNLLISARYLWVTLSLSGQHARTMAFNSSFKTWDKQRMERVWAWKNCIANEGTTHPLQRHPWMRHYKPLYFMNPMPSESWPITTSSTLHGLERDHLGNTPWPRERSTQ